MQSCARLARHRRWSRHIVERVPYGELHLVDASPWMVRFLRSYFRQLPNVQAHLNDGQSLPFERNGWMDLIFSANTLVELKLGVDRISTPSTSRAS